MKKIMLTLYTLLAVNVGSTMYAGGRVVDGKAPEKGTENKGKTAKPGEAAKGAPDAPKEVKAKADKTDKLAEPKKGLKDDVVNQNLNIVKSMHGVEPSSAKFNGDPRNQTFNLGRTTEGKTQQMNITFDADGNPKESKVIEYTVKKTRVGGKMRDITESRVTKKTTYNRDGSMDESILNSQGKEAQKIRYRKDGTFDITNFDANNKPFDSTSYDASGIATEYTDYRTKAEQELTPEQKTEVKTKADQARKNAEAAKEKADDAQAQAKIKENQDKMNQITDIINDPSISVEEKTAKVNEFLDDLQERTGKSDEEIMELKESMDNLISKIDEDQKNSSEQSKQDVTDAKATMIQRITKILNDFIARFTGRSVATGQAVSTAPVGLLNDGLLTETPGDNSTAGSKPISDPGSPKGVNDVESLDATPEEEGLF